MSTSKARALTLAIVVVTMGARCGPGGEFDGGVFPDAGPPPDTITAADIGKKCEYLGDGANPTNTCDLGLSCLIYSWDGAYRPNPPGAAANFTVNVWEDHFTIYRDDGVDEGFCTLIGTWQAPPACPVGTELKLFSTNLAACLKSCSTPADCGRAGYTCDRRFLDTQGAVCVRECGLDVPDCVRSGQFQRQATGGPNGGPVIAMHLNAEDFAGASYCDVGTGVCAGNDVVGPAGPGEACNDTRDCGLESVCLQGGLLAAVNPSLPANATGFCGQPCKPQADTPLGGGCRTGFACQAGFTFNHGQNPFDPDLQDANGFLLVNPSSGAFLEAGGFCFPNCSATGGNCSTYPGTTCGAANPSTFGWPWNSLNMCLLDPLRQ